MVNGFGCKRAGSSRVSGVLLYTLVGYKTRLLSLNSLLLRGSFSGETARKRGKEREKTGNLKKIGGAGDDIYKL